MPGADKPLSRKSFQESATSATRSGTALKVVAVVGGMIGSLFAAGRVAAQPGDQDLSDLLLGVAPVAIAALCVYGFGALVEAVGRLLDLKIRESSLRFTDAEGE